jgi:hypothetical protein
VEYLMTEAGIDRRHKPSFQARLARLVGDFDLQDRRARLAGRRLRDYRSREGIENYLRSPDGAGPWLEAGLITRPFLFHHAPKAYQALINYEKSKSLPPDLQIPTRSEILDQDLTDLDNNASPLGGARRGTQLYAALMRRRARKARTKD